MGSGNYPGERRKDSEKRSGSGPHPLNIGTVFHEGYTRIIVPEECDAWMIKKHNFLLRPHCLPEYNSWEDAGFEGAPYNPHYHPDEAGPYDAGWRDFPFKASEVKVYASRKKVKTVCRCIFISGRNEKEIVSYL